MGAKCLNPECIYAELINPSVSRHAFVYAHTFKKPSSFSGMVIVNLINRIERPFMWLHLVRHGSIWKLQLYSLVLSSGLQISNRQLLSRCPILVFLEGGLQFWIARVWFFWPWKMSIKTLCLTLHRRVITTGKGKNMSYWTLVIVAWSTRWRFDDLGQLAHGKRWKIDLLSTITCVMKWNIH